MLKSCYKHHKSDLIDVCFPEKEDVIDKLLQFISSDSITLDINSIFETYHLAKYLQVDCLQQLCLHHFTLNLNRNTLRKQLKLIERYSHTDLREFKERALVFGESGSPSLSGLYILQRSTENSTCLKIKSKHYECAHVLKEFKTTQFSSLQFSLTSRNIRLSVRADKTVDDLLGSLWSLRGKWRFYRQIARVIARTPHVLTAGGRSSPETTINWKHLELVWPAFGSLTRFKLGRALIVFSVI